MKSHLHHRAFTLIELLVVISVIAVLTGILLPALAGARGTARQTTELAAAQQLNLAYVLYAQASRDQVLPGFPTAAMVAGPIVVADETGTRITGETAQRYPWRLAPYLDYNFRGLYQSIPFLDELRQGAPEYASFGIDWRYLVSLFPSLGINATFVGGNEKDLGFNPAAQGAFGPFYVTRLDQPRHPDRLIVWASAREGEQAWEKRLGRPEGMFRVDSPYFARRRWDSAYDATATNPGNNSGFISLRHRGKAVVGLFDGHADMFNWSKLEDMRYWCNLATTPDWTLKPR